MTKISKIQLSEVFTSEMIVKEGHFYVLDEAAASSPGTLAYCLNIHFLQIAENNPNVSAIITTPALANEPFSKGIVVSPHPKITFFELYNQHHEQGINAPDMPFGIGTGCRIHPTAIISPRAYIGHHVEIGAYSVIEDFVHIGDNTFIGAHAIIGAEGLMPIKKENGDMLRVKHAGGVTIGKGVVILANAVIVKSIYRNFTTIGDYSQIGIMTTIGHGVTMGKYCVISGNALVAGHTQLGDRVWVGGNAAISHRLSIGDDAQINMGSIVVHDLDAGKKVSGNFAIPHATHVKHYLKAKS